MTKYFDKQIAVFHQNPESKEAIFRTLSDELMRIGAVNDQFCDNLMKREVTYPTGLLINGIGVAIPHTDSEYVYYSQVGFMSLASPVEFYQMGTTDEPVPVSLIFVLALKEAHEQLSMLQLLVEMFQTAGVLKALEKIDNKTELAKLLADNGLE